MMDFIFYAKQLNNLISEEYFRRNSIYYEYVSYINHMISLGIAEKFNSLALFLVRAIKKYIDLKNLDRIEDAYFVECKDFLIEGYNYLVDNELVGNEQIEVLLDPKTKELITELKQQPPTQGKR